jgi:UDP-N-acetylglucosamine 2-epimerase (non-hydrolysing)
MGKLKVMTVVGTRPEVIRLSRVLAKLDEHCDLTLVHTGQNYDYELNGIFFDDLHIRKPDHFLEAAGRTGAETMGNVIVAVDRLLEQARPDALLVLGDTNSCMAVVPAKRRKIPTFHMEAGNRCFDQRVPEEINRKIVDHIADVNMTYSGIAREYLLREGLPPDLIIKTGSPMFEVLTHYRAEIENSSVLDRLALAADQYFLVSAHREENVDPDANFRSLAETLNTVAELYRLPVVVSTHPRTRQRIDSAEIKFAPQLRFMKPLGFLDYNKLQTQARAVLSDSGTINEEASILNFRALNIREAHERPEGMEEAVAMMVGLNPLRVAQCLAVLETQPRGAERLIRLVDDYAKPNVADKVVRIIHSYTDYVNRVVWKKY